MSAASTMQLVLVALATQLEFKVRGKLLPKAMALVFELHLGSAQSLGHE